MEQFNNGLLVQYGTKADTALNCTITLPITFSNTKYIVMGLTDNRTSTSGASAMTGIYAKTKTTFILRCMNNSGTGSGNSNRSYISIGN